MQERRWLLITLYGILLATTISSALKAARPKFKIATSTTPSTSTTTSAEEPQAEDSEGDDDEGTTAPVNEGNGTAGHTLTGIPQIDYIYDPNLPRELNGYNLSDYPFYNSMPEDIDFKCDGLHDGFYASVPHKCQVYHHCLYGTRYDFLCANFTAFDQKTFICHFVSEVDCINSKKYWHRNDALYQATTSSTSTTTTSTTTTTRTTPVTSVALTNRAPVRNRESGRRRRPYRRRPAYDYYEEYYDDDEFDRSRLRGYDRRDYNEYDERVLRRDRDRDKDFRERDSSWSRDSERFSKDSRDGNTGYREKPLFRSNRGNPVINDKNSQDGEPRNRNRDQEKGLRSKDFELDSQDKEEDDYRYTDRRFNDYYDDRESVGANGSAEGVVKPVAPVSSVYTRPRTPPKIRRPVPLSEQDRYAYKVTHAQITTEEPRRKPTEPPLIDDNYYEDYLEDTRPRRPIRRRPTFRERDFYETRDRDLDRSYRIKYHEDEDEVRFRRYPERSRDRYYERDRGVERNRNRSLDRGKDRSSERIKDREREQTNSRTQDSDEVIQQARPLNHEKEPGRLWVKSEEQEETKTTFTTTASGPQIGEYNNEESETGHNYFQSAKQISTTPNPEEGTTIVQDSPKKYWKPSPKPELVEKEGGGEDEYSEDYYDEEEPVTAPPRTTIRIVKGPFLSSKGGHPNSRGLQLMGLKAPDEREENRSQTDSEIYDTYKVSQTPDIQLERYMANMEILNRRAEDPARKRPEQITQKPNKTLQRIPDEYLPSRQQSDDLVQRRPEYYHQIQYGDQRHEEKPRVTLDQQNIGQLNDDGVASNWSTNYQIQNTDQVMSNLPKSSAENNFHVTETSNRYYKNDIHDQPTGANYYRTKQNTNEVTRLQDIPESEYDVTLNEALTPSINRETNLPSGFILPVHRQLTRDTIIQPSENSYQFSRPLQQQQRTFTLSRPFAPSMDAITQNGDRRPQLMYSRIPEAIQVSESQYRHQQRGPWRDYTGF